MLIYLASPYSHPDSWEREVRFRQVAKYAARCLLAGHFVFSPITHSHPIARYGDIDALDGGFWLTLDFKLLEKCDEMWVLKMEGWENSKGVQQEILFAHYHGLPVRYLDPNEEVPLEPRLVP